MYPTSLDGRNEILYKEIKEIKDEIKDIKEKMDLILGVLVTNKEASPRSITREIHTKIVDEEQNFKIDGKRQLNLDKTSDKIKPETQKGWQEQFHILQQEQKKRGLHPMKESHERNCELLNKFMSIFRIAPEDAKKWLAKEPLVPKDMEFKSSVETREVACPLHSIFFLADSNALGELCPYLTAEDFRTEGPYNSSFLHMIISGIEYNAPQVSPAKCAEILLSKAPELKDKQNQLGSTPYQYAKHVKYGLHDNKKISVLNELLNQIK